MKVTVDTRHDSLEEALATVHVAFGSSTTQLARATVATERATAQVAKRAGTRARPAARPQTKKSPAKTAAPKTLLAGASPRVEPTSKAADVTKAPPSTSPVKRRPTTTGSARNGAKPVRSMNSASNIAPPGQADAIRAWAKTQRMEVKEAGRLPAAVIQAYQESPDH
jgi:hypothetical protein